MGSAYPAGADEFDEFTLRRKDERFKGVSFFFHCNVQIAQNCFEALSLRCSVASSNSKSSS